MEVKEAKPERPEAPLEDMDVTVPIDGNEDDAEQGQVADQDFGEAGEDGGFDGGYDED